MSKNQPIQNKKAVELAKKKQAQNKMIYQLVFGVLAVVLVFALITLGLTQCNQTPNVEFGSIAGYTDSDTTTDYVRMNVTWTDKSGNAQKGSVIVQLRPDVAPLTVANFQKLVSQKFYDGLTFHRVIEGFMIQGGCPKGNGSGNAGSYITGEFDSNGIPNPLSHSRGVISMARGEENDSASCQFFIVHEDSTFLDGKYAAFGHVAHGMDTVDAITKIQKTYNSGGELADPVYDVIIHSMTFVNKVG